MSGEKPLATDVFRYNVFLNSTFVYLKWKNDPAEIARLIVERKKNKPEKDEANRQEGNAAATAIITNNADKIVSVVGKVDNINM